MNRPVTTDEIRVWWHLKMKSMFLGSELRRYFRLNDSVGEPEGAD
jgi:hypothetical protein